ncbi:hypothetical protein HDF15_002660 [Granulicella mallensis]|uniref:Uncharacterized protein n=1 Tax=Granulicella mallensis TaxID=940614 RepID=A0A7W8EA31_9BACT|nr:hypothetical protein [Granulicella mallensis]
MPDSLASCKIETIIALNRFSHSCLKKKNLLVTKKGGMRDETALIPPSKNNTRYFTATRTITV